MTLYNQIDFDYFEVMVRKFEEFLENHSEKTIGKITQIYALRQVQAGKIQTNTLTNLTDNHLINDYMIFKLTQKLFLDIISKHCIPYFD